VSRQKQVRGANKSKSGFLESEAVRAKRKNRQRQVQVQQQIPFGNGRQEKQVQTQIPFGNEKQKGRQRAKGMERQKIARIARISN
jgi:hypothetical protein